jgi:hypothetical protein
MKESNMGLLFSILLIILGALAVYPAVVQTWPTTKPLLDKLMPYQGIIGIVGLIWGVFWALRLLAVAGMMMHFSPIVWLVSLIGAVVAVMLGLLLGYSLIDRHVLGNNAQFQQRGETFRVKLLARQASLGWAAIIVGVVNFLMLLVG